MRIRIHIYSQLRYYLPPEEKSLREKEWDMPEGATIQHIVDRLGLPKQVLVTILLNNSNEVPTASLKEGDVLHILPIMGGG
jgi:sulfur carrier protein ThiS